MSHPYVDAAWYVARGTGVVDLVLLTVVVALGVTTRSGRTLPGLPRYALATVHRTSSLLALVLLAIHVGMLLLDPYAQLRLVDVVLPFLGARKPIWLGFGTLACDVLLALILTSVARRRVGRRTWRVVHWSAYALFPLALAHGLGNGTDAGTPWVLGIAVGCTLAVLAAVAWRLAPDFDARPRRRSPAPAPARNRERTPTRG